MPRPFFTGRNLSGIWEEINLFSLRGNKKPKQQTVSARPGISVVIPLYNHEPYIEDAIGSVMSQTLLPLEVIVIDDGSTDQSAERMEQIKAAYPEVLFWSHPNQGAHYTINAAIHRARGEMVAILNSDDLYHQDRLERCAEVLQKDPSVSAVTTGIAFVDERGAQIQDDWYQTAIAFYRQIGDLSLALVNGNFFMTTSNLFIRRAIFEEIGLFSPLRYAHDLDFFLRMILFDKRIHFLDEPLLHYRRHRENTISQDHSRVRAEWAYVTARFLFEILKRRKEDVKDWEYLRSLVQITNKHSLTPLLVYLLGYFMTSGQESLNFLRPSTESTEFMQFLYEASK
jgi:glycosyltransferase involved in cell wall biosynthesis